MEQWQKLNPREQNLVKVGAVFFGILVFYLAVWQPLNDKLALAEKRFAEQKESLVWLQQQSRLVQNVVAGGGNSNLNLNQLINSTSRQYGVTISRYQPKNEDLQVWVEDVPFNGFMQWLNTLVQQHGVVIRQLDIGAGDVQGTVKVKRLQLGKA